MAAPPPPPPLTAAGKENAAQALREQVVRRVLASDALDSVKAHLRAALYAELKGSGSSAADWRQPQQPRPAPSLQNHVLNCLVAEYLLARQHRYSLSVFLAESGSGSLPQLSRVDLLRLVGVAPESRVHTLLAGGSPNYEGCLAEGMVAALGVLGGAVSTHAAGCQTEGDEVAVCSGGRGDTTGGATLISTQLAQRLQQIEEEYRQRSTQVEATAAVALEERMAAFQRECEGRCAAQLQVRLAAARDSEVAAARAAKAQAATQQLEAERARLERIHQERQAALGAREEELLERVRRQHRDLDAAREEQLRAARADEERLRAWRAECEAQLAAAQAAVRQQAQGAEAAARRVELQAAAGEQRLAVALAAAQQKEAASVRAQAAAEAELGRVLALQEQLAGALQEQGSLRQQLAAARAGYLAEQAGMQAELETLRREQTRLAAAAAPTGPCLSPEEATRLQRAVRRLMKHVDGLQDEVEACRRREQLWKGATAEADKLLGKAAEGQDRMLQHAEELRLELAAAVREVADLQHQAALAAAGVEGLQADVLQATSRDAQRWREGAEARLAAVRQEEEGLRRKAAELQQRALANRTGTAQGLQHLLASYVQGRRRASEEEEQDSGSPVTQVSLQAATLREAAVPVAGPAPAPAAALEVNAALLLPRRVDSQPDLQQQQQQQQQHVPPASLAPLSRTSSQILAAYRARQAQRSSTGGALPGRSRSPSLSQEASGVLKDSEAAGGGQLEGDGSQAVGAAPAPVPAPAAEPPVGDGLEGYYVDDFTSEDSKF